MQKKYVLLKIHFLNKSTIFKNIYIKYVHVALLCFMIFVNGSIVYKMLYLKLCVFFFFQVSMRATPASSPRTACLVRSGSPAVRAGPTGSTPGRAGSGPPTSWSVRTSAWSVRDSARTTRNRTSCSIQSNAPVSGSNFL